MTTQPLRPYLALGHKGGVLKFPDKVAITAIDSDTGKAVPTVALVLALRPRRKNDYCVGPIITDESGHSEFTRGACERTIDRAKEMFVMDYAGDLESCIPEVDIRLHPPDNIAGMISQYEAAPDFWGCAFDNPQELFSALRLAENSYFEPFHLAVTECKLLDTPEILCCLTRRRLRSA